MFKPSISLLVVCLVVLQFFRVAGELNRKLKFPTIICYLFFLQFCQIWLNVFWISVDSCVYSYNGYLYVSDIGPLIITKCPSHISSLKFYFCMMLI